MEYYSAIKKNEIMDGPEDDHTKWSKSGKDKHHYDIAYMWNVNKIIPMNLFTKQKQT